VIHVDAAFGEQLLNVSIGQPVAQVPAHRDSDGLWWKRKPAKLDLGAGTRAGRRRISSPCPSRSSVNATDPAKLDLGGDVCTWRRRTLPEPIIRQRNGPPPGFRHRGQ
jgi:hypothetical protein